MERCLLKGDRIRLYSAANQTEFMIDEVVGVGGSCIAYQVSYKENGEIIHKGILKEYFPAFLMTRNATLRQENAVHVPEQFAARFFAGLESFKHTYRVINEYLSEHISAANYHTVQMGLYEGNNTAYTLTSCDYGKSYDKLEDTDLQSMFRLMLSVTKAVELYHDAGFLHLDIKPRNILVLDDVTDVVKLFDFDSLIPLQKFLDRTVESIPLPGEFYVPELSNGEVRNIGIHTDIFEIGAMIFKRLFGRYPQPADMRYDAVYPFEQSSLCIGASPAAKHKIDLLLRKTIQISKRSRYQHTAQLKEQLKDIIDSVGSKTPYLMDLPKWQPTKHFVGRSCDVQELDRRLDEDGYVFVKGIGGLGKSELVKYYVKTFASKYHTVQFCKYDDNLKALVAAMAFHGVDEGGFNSFDELVRHKNNLLHTCDEHTLIIVDNFNVTHDKFLREFLPSGNTSFKVIFTTRCNLAADYYADRTLHLSKLSMEECKSLYRAHSGNDDGGDRVEAMIETIDYNTLVLVLLAETMRKTGKSPDDILTILENQELDRVQTLVFHEYDYSDEEIEEYSKIHSHLNVIFDIGRMSMVEKQLLKDMSLISQRGISIEEFLRFCDNDAFSVGMIDSMVDLGWLERRGDWLVMHPIVSDLLFMNADIPNDESYYALADNLENECNPDYTCHINVVMDKLACALHLDRRYKNEEEQRRILIKSKLGRLYANVYRPKHAKAALSEAVQLTNEAGIAEFLPFLYYFLGEVEKDFGTLSEAISFFKKSVAEGRKPENDFHDIVLDAWISIAECLEENGDMTGAKTAYTEALAFAEEASMDEYIYVIAKNLVPICAQLELSQDEQLYARMMEQYAQYGEEDCLPPELKEIEELVNAGDFDGTLRKYESFLERRREELGEESPIYQDTARHRWMYYAACNEQEQAMRLIAEDLAFTEDKYGAVSMEMAELFVNLAQILPKLQNVNEALRAANRAIDICRELQQDRSKIALEAKLETAKCYLISGQLDQAKAVCTSMDFSAFSGTEILADIVTSAGQVLCELSEYDIVENMCEGLLKRGTVDRFSKAQTYILYAICREQKGFLDEAEALCAKAKPLLDKLESDAVRREWLVLYYRAVARLQFRRGHFKNAIDILSGFLAQFPKEQQEAFFLFQLITERGLYHTANKDAELAKQDYALAERILTACHMPAESFVLLYNNISVNFINSENYEKAREYLDKIVAVKTSVLNPSTYTEALMCGNIGLVELYCDDLVKAKRLCKKAVKAFEKIGATGAADYLTSLHNLSLVYDRLGRYGKCHALYQTILKMYDETRMDADGRSRLLFTTWYIQTLLKDEKYAQATEFAKQEDQQNIRRFGENSTQRIEFLLTSGSFFKYFGSEFCMELYKIADDVVQAGGYEDTVYNARLRNLIGVCYSDFYEDHGFALKLFEQAKELFEEVGATDDEMYPILLSNIEYAKEKHFDQLVGELAQLMQNDSSNNEND